MTHRLPRPILRTDPPALAVASDPAPSPGLAPQTLLAYLDECRVLTLDEIRRLLPSDPRARHVLYDLVLDYPSRAAKALRPALCIAVCRALGGSLEAVLRSAAVLELYHNAFLIHDDVEDGSERRRDAPTLHREHGVPIAVNVGDAMLALALQPLLDNMATLGMGRALRILEMVARMARESAEGQAIELHWVRTGDWTPSDADYVRMVHKKTGWYTFVTPVVVGGIAAGASVAQLRALRRFASLLGVCFQIRDDVLNLEVEAPEYGKELGGDLWEGKHTLILAHALRAAGPADRARAEAILAKPRPGLPGTDTDGLAAFTDALARTADQLVASGDVTASGRDALVALARRTVGGAVKTEDDVRFLLALIDRAGSLPYARRVAAHWAARASRAFTGVAQTLEPSIHRDVLATLIDFVEHRDH